MFFNYTQLNLCEYPEYKPKDLVLDENGKEVECLAGQPTTPGAIMTDTFYAQVNESICLCSIMHIHVIHVDCAQ